MNFAKLANMEHYLIETNFPGFNRSLLVLVRQDEKIKRKYYYDLYQAGDFLGTIFQVTSSRGTITWDSIQEMDQGFVTLIGKQILIIRHRK